MNIDQEILELRKELSNRNYSPITRRTYCRYVHRYLVYSTHFSTVEPGSRLKDFLYTLPEGESRFGAFSAVQCFYRLILKKEPPYRVENRKKPKRLPDILSREEITTILQRISNPKHRLMITTLYASGLRIGELPRLQPGDLDFSDLRIKIRSGKGKKDRYTLMSAQLAPEYQKLILENRKTFPRALPLFLNQSGKLYSVRTIQVILSRAKDRAGILKPVTPHILRHSFATHLFYSGVSIGRIKDYLGHADINTTLIYTHLELLKDHEVKSPW